MEGKLTGFSLNRDGTQNITVTVGVDFSETYDELKNEPVEIEIKKACKHRSLDANRYCWKLIDLIAAKTGYRKSEVYRAAIRDIGGVSDEIICKLYAAETFVRNWRSKGLGWQAEVTDLEMETGWATILVTYGSSTYDTAQMSRLINSLIQDAEAIGIPTITPEQEQQMLNKWTEKKEKKPT